MGEKDCMQACNMHATCMQACNMHATCMHGYRMEALACNSRARIRTRRPEAGADFRDLNDSNDAVQTRSPRLNPKPYTLDGDRKLRLTFRMASLRYPSRHPCSLSSPATVPAASPATPASTGTPATHLAGRNSVNPKHSFCANLPLLPAHHGEEPTAVALLTPHTLLRVPYHVCISPGTIPVHVLLPKTHDDMLIMIRRRTER